MKMKMKNKILTRDKLFLYALLIFEVVFTVFPRAFAACLKAILGSTYQEEADV